VQTIASPNKYTGRIEPIEVVVIHTMEAPEGPQTAENIAAYFAKPATKASAHVCVDSDSEVRCVPDADTAWAAPGANANGLQLELAGYARQTAAEWDDVYSRAMLERAAVVAASWATAYGIPVRHLSVAELKAGARGFVAHDDVSKAFKKSTHWDPGPAFPWDAFLTRVAQLAGGAPPAPAAPGATFHGIPGVHTGRLTADGNFELVEDGVRAGGTVSRFQQVMGTSIDGTITKPRPGQDPLGFVIGREQEFLTAVVGAEHIANLDPNQRRRQGHLTIDAIEGGHTIRVRQFWLYNSQGPAVLGRGARVEDFDGIAGAETTRLHQHALNLATAGSRRY
jgi:hypothetical protein